MIRLILWLGLCLVLQESQLRPQQLYKRICPAKFYFKPGDFFVNDLLTTSNNLSLKLAEYPHLTK
jgi:hypothetical protein